MTTARGRRLTREEQTERNRAAVLSAARQVFMERGYVGATLDAISARARFSKGVVYSQFESKADMFLALLEARIDERAAENAAIAATAPDLASGLEAIVRAGATSMQRGREWSLCLVEFRAHAARDADLNRRYAELHERTISRLTAQIDHIAATTGQHPAIPADDLARIIVAMGNGLTLEHAATPGSPAVDSLVRVLVRGAAS